MSRTTNGTREPEVLPEKELIAGYAISIVRRQSAVRVMLDALVRNEGALIVACANPHTLAVVRSVHRSVNAFNSFDLLLPDGVGIVIASRILGGRIRERVSGPDVFEEFTRWANRARGISYFFLGSTPNVLARICTRMSAEFPNVPVVGMYSPPFEEAFSEWENEKIVRLVNESRASVLWVGMTAPKQELWIHTNKEKLEVKLIGAIGAAFDFFAEVKKRPSVRWQELGVEWLRRLGYEPRRLWKRSVRSAPIFFWEVLRQRLFGVRSNQ